MDVTVQHPELGAVAMMGLPFEIEAAPGSIRRHAPLLGQHTAEVMAEWSSAEPAKGRSSAATGERPLAGVRVIDPGVVHRRSLWSADTWRCSAPR